jgi:predicted phage terminase large subunit-like protein
MLLQIQAEDPEMFAAQYLNQPISTSAQLFTEQLMLQHVRTQNDEKFPALGNKTLIVDLATSGNNDDSVILCGQQDCSGNTYITDGIGGTWTTPVLAEMVIGQALKHRPVKILLEKSAAGEVFKFYLQQIAKEKGIYLPLDFIKVSNQKDAKYIRISTVSGTLKANKLFFLAGLTCWKNLFEQFTSFPRMRHDDYPDTVALMCQYFQTNGTSVQLVTSLAAYLLAQPAVPEYTLDSFHESHSGSMGSDFV